MFTKSDAAKLQGDFIPGGKRVRLDSLLFRKTTDYEIYRCCQQSAYDIQSGPIYCGDIAEYIAPIEDKGKVALCERHRPPKNLIEA
jgi:hypothetical protein